MQRHRHHLGLACSLLLLLLLLVLVSSAFVPSTVRPDRSSSRSSRSTISLHAAHSQPPPAPEKQKGRSTPSLLRLWVQRACAVAAPVGLMVALPLAGAPMRAGAAFDVEGISKALQEDTSKKYSDDGLGLVETLKKRSVQNKAKNDREIMEKTFLNGEAGIYGPFDKFVPVLKKDGQYVLLAEDEYNRLKAEKKIVGRDFVVDYQGDSAPEAVTEPEPAADAKEAAPSKSMLDDDADLLEGVEDAELL